MIEMGCGARRGFLNLIEGFLMDLTRLNDPASSAGDTFDGLPSVCLYSRVRVEEGYEKRRRAEGGASDRLCRQQV
jgi:hypothetical protein